MKAERLCEQVVCDVWHCVNRTPPVVSSLSMCGVATSSKALSARISSGWKKRKLGRRAAASAI